MSIFKKVSAFLTAIGIACSCVACGYNTINALTVDGVQIPAGVYIYYANSAYNQALSKLTEQDENFDTTDTDAVKAGVIEGKDTLTWIQDEATKMCSQYVVIEKKFEEYGLELDADTKSNISSMKDYYWANSQESFEKNGISESSFEKVITSSYKSDMIFEHLYGVDGENGTTEQEVYDHYLDNNIRCEYLALSLKDGEGNLLKSDGKAEIMDMAKDYQKRAENALKADGIDGVKAEMDQIRADYADYTASLTATEGEDAAAEDETTEEALTTEEETTEAEAAADTTEETAGETEDTTEETEDTTADEDTSETETETAAGDEEAETFNAPSASAEDETDEDTTAETEDTTADETTEDETDEDTTAETEDTTADETTEDETDEDETTGDETTEDETTEEETTEEETDPFANESIIAVIDESDYDDPADISYNPSEKTYKKLLDIQPSDYGKVYIVEEDEVYYLAVRYDIEERMNEDDLWTESTISSTVYDMFSDAFQEQLDGWTASASVVRNDAAYKRYDPFKFDFN